MKAIMKYEPPLVPPPRDYPGDFLQDAASALVGVGLIVNSEAQPGNLSLDKVRVHTSCAIPPNLALRGGIVWLDGGGRRSR